MTVLLLTEAFLYSPSAPQLCAVRLFETLQLFAWTEAEAPGVQRGRAGGLPPDEPLFCFETMLKACYGAGVAGTPCAACAAVDLVAVRGANPCRCPAPRTAPQCAW